MNVLAIDTSISSGSVALFSDKGHQGEVLLFEARKHSEHLMGQIDFLLKNTGILLSQVDGFAVTRGPGSFTGLRVGITVAKTLAMACGKKIFGISTLDLLVLGAGNQGGWICPMVDASRGEVYAALYESKPAGPQKIGGDWLLKPQDLAKKLCGPTTFTGEASQTFQNLIEEKMPYPCSLTPRVLNIPHASVIAEEAYRQFKTGEGMDPDKFYPYYVRRSNAEEKLVSNSR